MIESGTPGDASPRPYEALSKRARRRLAVRALVRSALGSVLLLLLYYWLPLGEKGIELSVGLAIGLVAFGAIVTVQIWRITRSDYPRLRAVESLATAIPLFLLLFAATYFMMDREVAESFSEPLNRTDALYFTVTVFATVGFGDITPVTEPARIVTTVQMVADLVIVGVVAKVVVGAVNAGLRHRAAESGADHDRGATIPPG
jgi:voltage-gated potassium channel